MSDTSSSIMLDIHDPPAVELAQMQQQEEVRCPADDWTGRTNAAERRKLQNRLNQRIYRRRRNGRSKPPKPESEGNCVDVMPYAPREIHLAGKFRGLIVAVENETELQDENKKENTPESGSGSGSESSSPCTNPRLKQLSGSLSITHAQLEIMMRKFEEKAHRDYILGSPRVDQLLTLIQFNVFRALLSNTLALAWTLEWLECSDPISPWNSLPSNSNPPLCPEALRPTHIQRIIKHHPWIDLWPIPQMRDNLLLAGDEYDEDRLCNDLVEFDGVTNEQTGLVVWNQPWDPMGWEVSETFLANWRWTIRGCVELQESTNYWRLRRGEKPLIFDN